MGDMTEHFDWADAFTSSRYPWLMKAARGRASGCQEAMLYITFTQILERVRRKFGVPIRSLSAFRTIPIVKALRKDGFSAALTSLHLNGMAVDFTAWHSRDKHLLLEMYDYIRDELSDMYGELILYKIDSKPDRIHVALQAHGQPQFCKIKEG